MKDLLIRITFVFAICMTFTPSCVLDPSVPNGYALVYGISRYDQGYPEGEGNNLTYADDDADAVAAMFGRMMYQVVSRTDTEATLTNLRADIDQISGVIGPGETFVFYYSGHGTRLRADDSGENRELVAQDVDVEWLFLYGSIDVSRITDLTATISDDHIQELLRPIPTNRKIIILDACNSGGFIGSRVEIDGVSQDSDASKSVGIFESVAKYLTVPGEGSVDLRPDEALVIAAAGEQEDSYEASFYGHGVFTYHLLNSPSQGDLNGDGFVTTGECYEYIGSMIDVSWSAPSFTPRISGGPVDFVLLRAE